MLIITALIVCSSCSTEVNAGTVSCNSVSSEKLKIQYDKFNFCTKKEDKTTVEYTIADMVPNKLYDIEVNFSMTDESYFNKQDSIDICINADKTYNLNGERTHSVVEKINDYSFKLHHVFLSDKNGEYAFKVSVGSDENLFCGEIKLEFLNICLAELSDGLKVIADNAEGVTFIFNDKDYNDMESIKMNAETYLEKCANLKRNLINFADADNREIVFVFNEHIPSTGLSGQLIYINYSELEKLFSEEITNSPTIESFISVLCHEMSHTFDYDCDFQNIYEYCFDKEFFTILRQFYALTQEGYLIDYDYLGVESYLSNNIYNYQDFLKVYLKSVDVLAKQDNWLIVKEFIVEHQRFNNSLNDIDKVNMLVSETSKKCGYDIVTKIGDKQYKTIISHFE